MGNRIESSAKKSYVFMTYLKNDAIKITTRDDSVVTLTGTVTIDEKRYLKSIGVNPLCHPDITAADAQWI